MSKNMKKLISGLLALTTMLSSLGMVALADETDPAATAAPEATATATPAATATAEPEATATAEPEATATVAPTQTPAAGNTAYDNDDYYKEALSLVSALGIITGYEDGSVKPEASVSRAEMSAIVLRMLALQANAGYTGIFTDVQDSHWAASTIQTAYDAKIINGMGDGTFNPDGDVMYEQVMKMLVAAMNRDIDAQNSGGYPNGYLVVADSTLKLTKNAPGKSGVAAERGIVIKAVYNALQALYPKITGYENGNPKYETQEGVTLAVEKFDTYKQYGVVTATNKKSMDASLNNLQDGQVAIRVKGYDDSTIYTNKVANAEDYVANYVTYYYQKDRDGDEAVIAMFPSSTKNTEVVMSAADIEDMSGFADGHGKIEYYVNGRTKTYNVDGATVIYNGQVYDFNSNKETAEEYDKTVKPVVGTVKIVDYDNDGTYDAVVIDKYETMVITSATDKRVNGQVGTYENGAPVVKTKVIDVTNDNDDKIITVYKAGDEVKPKNLKKDDVATVKMNLEQTVIEIKVSDTTITGSAQNLTSRDGKQFTKVNNQEYEIDAVAYNDIALGKSATFYLDEFDRIARVENSTGTNSRLSGNEKYGWVVNSYIDTEEGDNEAVLKMFKVEDGSIENYKFSSTVELWASNATEPISVNSRTDAGKETLTNLSYIMLTPKDNKDNPEGRYQIRLCKFQANSNNEINKLYIASDSTKVNTIGSKVPVIIDAVLLQGASSVGNVMGGKYLMPETVTEITVPEVPSLMKNTTMYKTAQNERSKYLSREGNGMDLVIAEVENTSPAMVIRFTADPDSRDTSVETTDGFTSGDNSTFMVKDISIGVDDDDNTIYYITATSNGQEVTYQTSSVTSVSKSTDNASIFINTRRYSYTNLWDAQSMINGTTKVDFMDVVKEGDVFTASRDGSTLKYMLKIGNAEEIANKRNVNWTNTGRLYQNSSTRDGWNFGKVLSINSDEEVSVLTGLTDTYTLALDPSKMMDVYEITFRTNEDGSRDVISQKVAKEAVSPDELMVYDDQTGEGDMVLSRVFNGGMRENYVFRYIEA